jgi:hypothetical protein
VRFSALYEIRADFSRLALKPIFFQVLRFNIRLLIKRPPQADGPDGRFRRWS